MGLVRRRRLNLIGAVSMALFTGDSGGGCA
jgi:hypothetical protein